MTFAARYDLAHRNIGFDFYAWQTHAILIGATEIVFGVRNYGKHRETADILARRYRSIIQPGPALMGLPSREGDDGIECCTHRLTGIIAHRRSDFPRLKSVLSPGNARYTVTLRNVPVHPHRNSPSWWRVFAKEIGAALIDDWHDKPIALHERVALYAGAKMNFGVINGPMGLLMLSAYPMMMCGCGLAANAWRKHGVEMGEQPPFLLPHQSLMWEQPSLKAMMAVVNRIERTSC